MGETGKLLSNNALYYYYFTIEKHKEAGAKKYGAGTRINWYGKQEV